MGCCFGRGHRRHHQHHSNVNDDASGISPHKSTAVRDELVELYAPIAREAAMALAAERRERLNARVGLQIEWARRLVEEVSWLDVARYYARQGYHAVIISAGADKPWDIADATVTSALHGMCAVVARHLSCRNFTRAPHELRIGDFGTALQPNGSVIINWASLADATLWQSLHHGHGNWARTHAAAVLELATRLQARGQTPEPAPESSTSAARP